MLVLWPTKGGRINPIIFFGCQRRNKSYKTRKTVACSGYVSSSELGMNINWLNLKDFNALFFAHFPYFFKQFCRANDVSAAGAAASSLVVRKWLRVLR